MSLQARLLMNLVAGGLLLAALAYDWLGNFAHELIGTAMFGLLVAHNTFNSRWYGSAVRKGGRDLRGWLNIAIIAALAAAMLVLLITSIIISRSLFSALPIASSFGARQLHAQAAYWALVIVAVHVGMRWGMIMTSMRSWLRLGAPNAGRTWVLRIVALSIAAYGVHSWVVVGTGSRLMAEMTMNFWNFEEAVLRFFLHQGAVAGLLICVAHYTTAWLQRLKQLL
ncbi:DUF4405 domain-containing protein [Rhizobium laguerreae]|uniref:DUF4405 domain-containing protein n=1 Tax=Rhizobium laguerreae TaxID=1076926 RepID=UPI001C910476|nr:DUF4405 domain-containing protein [Rhizobium laguerreae]MBY3036935.1 DUF4405 domain-containing protein [Rhizobium laguerreae]MBY3098553.1 DUF4405 domain-containing protein [Rhizobium laguerreae]